MVILVRRSEAIELIRLVADFFVPFLLVSHLLIPARSLIRPRSSVSFARSFDSAEEFGIYLTYVRKLGFEDTPDYDYLRNLMSSVLKRINEPDDGVFDWMKIMEAQRVEREKERERERERERVKAAAAGAGTEQSKIGSASPAVSVPPQAPPTPGPERSMVSASVAVLNGSMAPDQGSFAAQKGSTQPRGTTGSGSPIAKPLPDTPTPSPGLSDDTRPTNLLGVSPATPYPNETSSSMKVGGEVGTQGTTGLSSAYAVPVMQPVERKKKSGFLCFTCGGD